MLFYPVVFNIPTCTLAHTLFGYFLVKLTILNYVVKLATDLWSLLHSLMQVNNNFLSVGNANKEITVIDAFLLLN